MYGSGQSTATPNSDFNGCLNITNWGGPVAGGGGNLYHIFYDINASGCCDRYGSYTEVNPLYESVIFCIKH